MIIAFSGVDGAGKSTQIDRLEQHLSDNSHDVVVCWARGGYTPLFEALKRLVRRVAGRRLPSPGRSAERERAMGRWWVRRVWLLVSIIDLALLYGLRVRWWRLRGKTVICDRYVADTGFDFRFNFPGDKVESWWLWRCMAALAPRPDVWFLMLLPVEESMRRCREKNEPFSDSEERFHERLELYRKLADSGDHVVLDARESIDDTFAAILAACERAAGRAS